MKAKPTSPVFRRALSTPEATFWGEENERLTQGLSALRNTDPSGN